MKQNTAQKQGFTLVELSIVLVIIGLVVGGVVGGQALIGSARIGAQVQQLTQYETAYRAFQLQYDAIPGDMIDASDYWPGATNGDGNNRISSAADEADRITNENIKFFEHLSRAGVVPQTYTNVWALGQGYPVLEMDSGKGMVSGSSIRQHAATLHQLSMEENMKLHTAALYLNVSSPDAASPGGAFNTGAGVMTSVQAKSLDKKIDDGSARTGKFQSHKADGVSPCLDGDDGDYLLSNTQATCMGAYILE
jgi:prepilin-type N-terminal cleavage/methylation domain-containing protein